MGPELLIPILAPMVVEMIKWVMKKVFNEVPPPLPPLLSAGVGAALGAIPGMESTILEGLELGLAGTGLHQVTRKMGLTGRSKHERATDKKLACILPVILAGALLPACSHTKEASRAMLHGAVDSGCQIAHKSVDLALGPIEDVYADTAMAVNAVKGP